MPQYIAPPSFRDTRAKWQDYCAWSCKLLAAASQLADALCSVPRRDTFNHLTSWLDDARQHSNSNMTIMVRNRNLLWQMILWPATWQWSPQPAGESSNCLVSPM